MQGPPHLPSNRPYDPSQEKKGFPVFLIVILVAIPAVLVVVGILGTLAIFGVRKYIAQAKQAEAMGSLRAIASHVNNSYEAFSPKVLCHSASSPVPKSLAQVRGRKYQSSTNDWSVDVDREHTGFACVNFEMSGPQYYQYDYQAPDAEHFVATAEGDLDADGIPSHFEIKGHVANESLVLGEIEATNPDE